MPPPRHRPGPGQDSGRPWGPALAATAGLMLAMGGWWLGSHRDSPRTPDPQRSLLEREAQRLGWRADHQEASPADQQRLLELLLGLQRTPEAIARLEIQADREPERWPLRLLLAQLRRDQNDGAGAERELRQILNRHPGQIDTLELLSLLKLQRGQGAEAEAQVHQAYSLARAPELRPEALDLGLLLAELQQRRHQGEAALQTYLELARTFPQDQRPLIALALLSHASGDDQITKAALVQARRRGEGNKASDPLLDRLESAWGLGSLRGRSGGGAALRRTPLEKPTGHPGP